ncbi:MAG: hypothetical protein ACJAV9_001183, partial [Urechidicola sp.]
MNYIKFIGIFLIIEYKIKTTSTPIV